MGLFDELAGAANMESLTGLIGDNKDLMGAAASLLSGGDDTVGSAGGAQALLAQLASSGLGEQVSSWLADGANQSVDPQQLMSALDSDTLKSLAAKAGLDPEQAAAGLAAVLPGLIDQLSSSGKLPDGDTVNQLLAKFL